MNNNEFIIYILTSYNANLLIDIEEVEFQAPAEQLAGSVLLSYTTPSFSFLKFYVYRVYSK